MNLYTGKGSQQIVPAEILDAGQTRALSADDVDLGAVVWIRQQGEATRTAYHVATAVDDGFLLDTAAPYQIAAATRT